MTTTASDLPRPLPAPRMGPFRPRRLAVVIVLAALAVFPGALGAVTRQMMADAFTGVSVFVALTLLAFYGAEKLFRFNIGTLLNRRKAMQVPLAALLGMMPGCGGAVMVVAAYSAGHVGFGAVVATLTATMGDAAFLLLATRPDAALVVLPLSFVVGIVSGWIVDRINKLEFRTITQRDCALAPLIGHTRPADFGYFILAIPGLVVGIAGLLNIALPDAFAPWTTALGLSGAFLGLMIWATSQVEAMTNAGDAPLTRMAEETSFITIWVIGAYLAYAYFEQFTGFDLGAIFRTIAPLMPLAGILIGLIPGCGPQILVTTLYLNGLIPFAALIGNAISNDGDALFPAIALNRRAAIAATAYSTVPALVVAYGFYILAPGFLN